MWISTIHHRLSLLVILVCLLYFPPTIHAKQIHSYKITDETQIIGNPNLSTVYWHKSISVPWISGKVILSGSADGAKPVNGGPQIEVYGSNTADQTRRFVFKAGCSQAPMEPLDITHMMGPKYAELGGDTQVLIRLNRQSCLNWIREDGIYKMSYTIGPIYLVHMDDTDERITPFLDLPWNYESKMRFEEAALSLNTYFDHAYPFFSAAISEDATDSAQLMHYAGDTHETPYSGYDGYGWGQDAGVSFLTPVRAAASGIASYQNSKRCGHMILIDHGNGFQTRYCQLSEEGLITTQGNITVQAGQTIGKVGQSLLTPTSELYFVVVHDKNGDGDFEDDIPGGIVDPFGWQGQGPDPWEHYTSTESGRLIQGSKSRYLWKKHLLDGTYTLPESGAKYFVGAHTIDFQNGTKPFDTLVRFVHLPKGKTVFFDTDSQSLESLGTRLKVTMHNGFLSEITQFSKPFSLTIRYDDRLYSRFKKDSIAIYSTSDGIHWAKEPSTLDTTKKTVTAQISHLTDFAVMGERYDAKAPNTTATLSGTLKSHFYTSPVTVFLSAQDGQESSQGIAYTMYKLSSGLWNKYITPFIIDAEGLHTIYYFSEDNDGNTEEMQSTQFEISYATQTPTPSKEESVTRSELPSPTTPPTTLPSPISSPTLTPPIHPSSTPVPQTTSIPSPQATPSQVRERDTSSNSVRTLATSDRSLTPISDSDQSLENSPDEENTVLGASDNTNTPIKQSFSFNWFLILIVLILMLILLFSWYRSLSREKHHAGRT